MTIEEYIEVILYQLEKANDCEDVERIINRSVAQMRDIKLNEDRITSYLHALRAGLIRLSPGDFDSVHWCNIHCAVMYLNRLSVNSKK